MNDQWLIPVPSQIVRHIVEQRVDLAAQTGHGGIGGDRDQRRDQRIFDRIGPFLAAKDFPEAPHAPNSPARPSARGIAAASPLSSAAAASPLPTLVNNDPHGWAALPAFHLSPGGDRAYDPRSVTHVQGEGWDVRADN